MRLSLGSLPTASWWSAPSRISKRAPGIAAASSRERVLPLLDAAVRQFESIGMPGWIERSERLLRGEIR